jgi:hypothetical protein
LYETPVSSSRIWDAREHAPLAKYRVILGIMIVYEDERLVKVGKVT